MSCSSRYLVLTLTLMDDDSSISWYRSCVVEISNYDRQVSRQNNALNDKWAIGAKVLT